VAFALEWYPRYSQLFMTDTAGWSCEAVGAFDRLLDFAWVNGGVENDEEVMARICGLERKAFAGHWRARLREKFSVRMPGGRISNRKLEEVREEQLRKTEKWSNAGRTAALAGWKKRRASGRSAKATAMRSHNDRNAMTMPVEIGDKREGRKEKQLSAATNARASQNGHVDGPKPGSTEYRTALVAAYIERLGSWVVKGNNRKAELERRIRNRAHKLLRAGDFNKLENLLARRHR